MKHDKTCEHCLMVDGKQEYNRTVAMPLNGSVQDIDYCIHHIVAALNAGGVHTFASCCGHGIRYGNIVLDDGRVLVIHPETPKDTTEWRELVREGRMRKFHED